LAKVSPVVCIRYDGVQTLDLTGPAEVFAAAKREDPSTTYEVVIASTAGRPITSTSGCEISTHPLERVRPRPSDIVLVAGGIDEGVRAAVNDRALLRWLVRAARVVRPIGSVCSGAFVLAATGVLDGLRVATHWAACAQLARFRPALNVDRDAIFVREGNVWTSAGVTTGIDMALAMLEEYHERGRALADAVAARLVLYPRRPGFQSQFSDPLVAQKSASDPLGPSIAWAGGHLRTVDVDALARRVGMSPRTFHRRCLAVLETTPAKLIERLRVEHARTLLASGDVSAKALAAACGFGTTARMNRAFVRSLGFLPRDYRLLFRRLNTDQSA
jgi:transcriptional regulator GlxA family with amidase domain